MMNLKKFLPKDNRTKLCFFICAIGISFAIAPHLLPDKILTPPNKINLPMAECIKILPAFGPYKEALIETNGTYCIAENFWQKRLSDFAGHSGPGPHRHLIGIRSSDVLLDLSGNTLKSDGHSSGIAASLDYRNVLSPDPETIQSLSMASNITIRNGVLDLRGLGTAVAQFRNWRMYTIDEEIPVNLKVYEKTKITLENLLIITDNIGIILEGDGNVIRNCLIESGGIAAIAMAGPNGKIMNNTIILTNPFIPGSMKGTNFNQKGTVSQLFAARKEPKAAIVLHQASGSIITGNRIEVKGASKDRHNIYLTDASENIRVEGNTFVGTEPPVTLVKGSTVILKKNAFEPRKSWWEL